MLCFRSGRSGPRRLLAQLLGGALAGLVAGAAPPPRAAATTELMQRAIRLELGDQVAPDPAQAMTLFCRAALLGSEAAAIHVAAWLLDPNGESYDPGLAKSWLALTQRGVIRSAWRAPPPRCPSSPPQGLPAALALLPDLVARAASAAGLDAALVKAVIQAESAFHSEAVSPRGAIGLMQLMPGTAAQLGVTDPFDVEQNLRGGTTFLAQLLTRYGGAVSLALAAYNAGPEPVDRCRCVPNIEETRAYVARVLANYAGGGYGSARPAATGSAPRPSP